jgi:peroxiredoxin
MAEFSRQQARLRGLVCRLDVICSCPFHEGCVILVFQCLRYSFRVRHLGILASLFLVVTVVAQPPQPEWTNREKPIADQIGRLRNLPDYIRGNTQRELALQIRALGASPNKLRLAMGLASRATEGDFGRDNLQEVTSTLEKAIAEQRPASQDPYLELASLVRYEHMNASIGSPQFIAAMKRLEEEDQARNSVNFTLTDLNGKSWTLKDLKGKIVMLNFWATWCPPCRKEMPDLESLYKQFEPEGFIILGVSDDEPDKIREFVQKQGTTYPVLLDPGSKVNHRLHIEGIPKTFVYDREGKIVSESIDMRTKSQFLAMLQAAGLK